MNGYLRGVSCTALGLLLLLVTGCDGEAGLDPRQVAAQPVEQDEQPLPADALVRLGTSRMRAGGLVRWLAYTADGTTLMSVTHSLSNITKARLQFWDASSGRLRQEPAVPVGFLASGFTFDRDGNIASVDDHGTYYLRDGRDGKELRQIKLVTPNRPPPHVLWASIAPKASLLAVRVAMEQIVLFDLQQGKQLCSLALKAKPSNGIITHGQSLTFTPDGTALAVASEGSRIEVFDVPSGKKRLEFTAPIARVDHLEFSPDGRHLLCAGFDQERWLVRDWAGRRQGVRLTDATSLTRSAFSADGRLVALTGAKDRVTVHAVEDGKEVCRLPVGEPTGALVAFAPDGRTLALAAFGGAISQWRIPSGERLPASAEPSGALKLHGFSPDGKELLALTNNRHVALDRTTGRVVRHRAAAETGDVRELDLSPDGRLLAVWRDKQVLLIDAQTGKERHRLGIKGVDFAESLFAGRWLLVDGSDRAFHVWDTETCRFVGRLTEWDNFDLFSASPDGRWVAAAVSGTCGSDADDHDVRVWDVKDCRQLRRFRPQRGSAFHVKLSADGRQLVLVTGRQQGSAFLEALSTVDVASGIETPGPTLPEAVGCLAVAPDGRTVAISDQNAGTLRLWELASGKERHVLTGHKTSVDSLVFSADGALLGSTSSEAPGYVWDVYRKHSNAPAWTADAGPRLWDALANADARVAFQAIRTLVCHPDQAVALLRARLQPAPALDGKRVRQWLRDMDSDDFATRQSASHALEQLCGRVEGVLVEALRGKLTAEARRRLEAVFAKLDRAAPESLRTTRALEVMEQVATPAARELLRTLAAGDPAARRSREAAEVVARLR